MISQNIEDKQAATGLLTFLQFIVEAKGGPG